MDDQGIIIKNVCLFDGKTSKLRSGLSVRVADGRIQQIAGRSCRLPWLTTGCHPRFANLWALAEMSRIKRILKRGGS